MDLSAIEQVLERHREALMAVPGVMGTAIGVSDGTPCIRVFVARANTVGAEIPTELEGFAVVLAVTDPFEARRDL